MGFLFLFSFSKRFLRSDLKKSDSRPDTVASEGRAPEVASASPASPGYHSYLMNCPVVASVLSPKLGTFSDAASSHTGQHPYTPASFLRPSALCSSGLPCYPGCHLLTYALQRAQKRSLSSSSQLCSTSHRYSIQTEYSKPRYVMMRKESWLAQAQSEDLSLSQLPKARLLPDA